MKVKKIFAIIGKVVACAIAILLLGLIAFSLVMDFLKYKSFGENEGIVTIAVFAISMVVSATIILLGVLSRKKKENEEKLRGADSEEHTKEDSKSDVGWVGIIALLALLGFFSVGVGFIVFLLIILL